MKVPVCTLILFLLVLVYSQAASGSVVFTHPNPQAGAEFGSSMAFVGDINGDGVPDLLVGAPEEAIGVFTPGQVFVFSAADGSVLLSLNNPSPQARQ